MRNFIILTVLGVLVACERGSAQAPGKGSSGEKKLIREAIKPVERVPSLGTKRVSGVATEVRLSFDGKWASTIVDPGPIPLPGVPPTVKAGALWVVPVEGGDAFKAASGVSNWPGGILYGADSKHLALLAAWDPTVQAGELKVLELTAGNKEAKSVSSRVSYMLISPSGSTLAFISEGVLNVGPLPAGPFRKLAGEVATAEFAPDEKHIYFRRRSAAGGGLHQVDLSNEKATPRRIVDQAGEFMVSTDSKWVGVMARSRPDQHGFDLLIADAASLETRKISQDAVRFAFSKDCKWVARLELGAVGAKKNLDYQDLELGDLQLTPLAGGKDTKLGQRVRDISFTDDSKTLFFRENYKQLELVAEGKTERVGDLSSVDLSTMKVTAWQKRSPNYAVSPDGNAVAFTARVEKPEYSRHLFLSKLTDKAAMVKDWIYEYQFTPDSKQLLYRASCTRNGRSCDLLSTLVDEPQEPAKALLHDTFSFKLDTKAERVLGLYAHMTDELFDVFIADLASGKKVTIDQFVNSSVYFAGTEGSHLVYSVAEKNRAGLYTASAKVQ